MNYAVVRQSRKFAVLSSAVLLLMVIGACAGTGAPATATQDPSIQQTTDALQTQVAEANSANATRDAEAAALMSTATQFAVDSATATAQSVIDKTATSQAKSDRATATADAEVTATQIARATGTVQAATITELLNALYEDHSEANIAALDQFLDVTPPEFGPESGRIRHEPNDEFVEGWVPEANVRYKDFVLRVKFLTPYASAADPWDFSVFFRSTGSNSQFRLTVTSAGFWTLDEWQGDINRLAERNSGSIRVSSQADVPMTIMLVVRGERGLFFANSQYIGLMDVSHKVAIGDIFLGIGAYEGDEKSGEFSEFEEFSVWRVPSP